MATLDAGGGPRRAGCGVDSPPAAALPQPRAGGRARSAHEQAQGRLPPHVVWQSAPAARRGGGPRRAEQTRNRTDAPERSGPDAPALPGFRAPSHGGRGRPRSHASVAGGRRRSRRSGMEAEGLGDAAPRGGESCHGVRRRPRPAHRPSLAPVTGQLLAGRRRRVLGARLGDRVARRPGLGARCDRPAAPHMRARREVGACASAAVDRGCRHDPRRPCRSRSTGSGSSVWPIACG